MDSRKFNSGMKGNKGGGRNTKDKNQLLAERLDPLDDTAFKALKEGLEDCQSWAVKLWFQYRFGLPKQQIEQMHTTIVWNEEKTYEKTD